MSGPKIIVNADDFGWDENRTRAILEAYEKGLIHTTTAMANMPWFDKAIEMACGTGLEEHIGLHLCLTEGHPLTDRIKNFPRFCDKDGNFNASFHVRASTRLSITKDESLAVAEEATAQMEKFCSKNLPWKHLDSHHHSHTDWSIARVVMPIAKKMGFTSVRRTRNLGAGMGVVNRVYKLFFDVYLKRQIGFEADFFGSYQDVVADKAKLKDCHVIEMMVHPMYKDGTELSMGGQFLDTNHPMQDIRDPLVNEH